MHIVSVSKGTVLERARTLAMRLYGCTRREVYDAIYLSENDPGEWSPTAVLIINLEQPNGLSEAWFYHATERYPAEAMTEFSERLSDDIGLVCFTDYVNSAVAAVYCEGPLEDFNPWDYTGQ